MLTPLTSLMATTYNIILKNLKKYLWAKTNFYIFVCGEKTIVYIFVCGEKTIVYNVWRGLWNVW